METDQQRFERLVEPHLKKLYVAAYRLTGDPADAEDLVQETLVKAYRSLDQLVHEINPTGWTFIILKNTFLNGVSKNNKRPRPFPDPDTIEKVQHPGPSIDNGDGFEQNLAEALMALPSEMRTALIAREVEGLSYQEIADRFGVSLGAVKTRINRGREKLRQLYAAPRAH